MFLKFTNHNKSVLICCSTPMYNTITNQNSAILPACFTLKLNKPMPICVSLVSKIQQGQQWQEVDSSVSQPLLNLIVNHSSEGKMSCSNNKGLFVVGFYIFFVI